MQTACGDELKQLETVWMGLMKKNVEIPLACEEVEQDIQAARAKLEAR